MIYDDNQKDCQPDRSKWVFHLEDVDHKKIHELIFLSLRRIEFSEMGFQALKANLEVIGRILDMDV